MESEIRDLREEIKKLIIDVALIKNALLNEGELTDWAKEELEDARKRNRKISHEEVKKLILEK